MPTTSDKSDRDAKRPEATFRIGYVSASIFAHEVENDGESRLFRSVSLQRSFLDGDERKWNSSFSLAELPQAIRCLQLAQHFVEQREAQLTAST